MKTDRSALVTGATGFIGQHICQQLHDRGWRVTILRRESSQLGILGALPVTHCIGDITDSAAVRSAIDQPFDAVFHVAADTSVWRQQRDRQTRINVEGTGNVLEAVRAAGVGRLIHTSSVAVYGFPDSHPIREQTPRDTSAYWINYFRSKAAAEDLVLEAVGAGLDAVVINPAHVMGPLDQHNWTRMIKMVAANTLPGIPPGSGSFADAREVARAQINAVHSAPAGEKYLLGGENHSLAAVVGMIGEILGQPPGGRVMPAWLLKSIAQLKQLLSYATGKEPDLTPESIAMVCGHEEVDSSKAIAELDYRITPTPALLADTIQWLRAERLL